MDTMNFMANVQPAAEKPLVKPNVSAVEKNTTKNFGAGAEKQDKDFSDVLGDAVKQTEIDSDAETQETPSELSLLAATVPAVVVDLSKAAQPLTVEEGSGEASLAENLSGKLQPNVNLQSSSDKLTAFINAVENVLPEMENAAKNPAPVVSVENKTGEQELLNMLNSKGATVKMQAVSEQVSVVQLQVQPEKQQTAVISQVRLSGEETGSLSTEKKAGFQEKQPDLSQQNFFSSNQDGGEETQSLRQKALLHDAKQPKTAVAEVVNENMQQNGKGVQENNIASLPETVNNQEHAKGDGFAFTTNAFEMKGISNQPLSQAVPAETPEAMAKYKIADQIIEQAKLIKTTEDTQMVIKLRPEHLGDLTLKVTVEHGVVSATFHSDNASVRSLLETSLFQLKQELATQGIKVDNVGVYAGLGEFMSNGQNQANSQQQSSRFKNRKIDLADFDETAETAISEKRNDNLSADGVDYRI